MIRYKNIIVSGDVGTGTTTLAKGLAQKLGWQHISAGDFFRSYQKEHHIPLWNKQAVPDRVEKDFDRQLLQKIKKESAVVFDAHYAAWFAKDLKNVFRILLITDKNIANQRILAREHTHKETIPEIDERRRQLRAKFKNLYSNDDYENPKYFHLVIDTTNTDIDSTISIAHKKFIQPARY